MKPFYLFSTVATFWVALSCSNCSKPELEDSMVNTKTANTIIDDGRVEVRNYGLVHHQMLNPTLPPPQQILFSKLASLAYDNGTSNALHYAITNNSTVEPMKTILANEGSLDGIFLGVGSVTTIFGKSEPLFIALVSINLQQTSSTCAEAKMNFVLRNGTKKFFKCTNRNLGTWVSISETDPIITSYNANKKGIFIGINNLKNHILIKPKMYFYKEFKTLNPQFVAVDKMYFTRNSGEYNPNPNSPFFLSTFGFAPLKCVNQHPTNHGNVRPCPEFCPE